MRVVICGGGVIGACAAYFLAKAGAEPVLIERAEVACGASGKSGGFLALDWCDGGPLGPLARRSFALHRSLAEAMPGRWGYRGVETLHLLYDARRPGSRARGGDLPLWLAADIGRGQRLGSGASTAQIDPAAFTRAMLEAAIAAGGGQSRAVAIDLARNAAGRVTGVITDLGVIEGDAVILALGPWAGLMGGLDLPPVHALLGHSLIYDTGGTTPPMAFFVDHIAADGTRDTPEIVSRADGTVYISGLPGYTRLPADPLDVAPEPVTSRRLESMVRDIAPGLATLPLVARQACYRPVTSDGLPLIGPVPHAEGAFAATGHSVWGMLNAPATGELLASMVTGNSTPALDPAPFALDRPGL